MQLIRPIRLLKPIYKSHMSHKSPSVTAPILLAPRRRLLAPGPCDHPLTNVWPFGLRPLFELPSLFMSLRVFAAVVLAACVAGCENGETSRLNNPNTPYLAASSSSAASQGTSGYDPISYWDGDGVTGAPSVQIHLSEERAYFYKGDQLVGVSQISTGREGIE